jgi:hypothetical protein
MSNDTLLKQASEALGIDQPIAASRVTGNSVEIWLYGGDGEPLVWTRTARGEHAQPGPALRGMADFRIIPGVGGAIYRALRDAGISTWAQLKTAEDDKLLAIPRLSPRVLRHIRAFLAEGDGS